MISDVTLKKVIEGLCDITFGLSDITLELSKKKKE